MVSAMNSRAQDGVWRALDLTIASVLVLCVLPVLLTAIVAIAVSDPRSSVFFRQQRTGRGGRRFSLYKLRTMCPDAEARKAELRELSEVPWPDFRLNGDPRVTRLGRLLRRTSLDELPQLFNVLRGDMALVGPRPTSFSADTYEPWQLERLEVRPGLTGPWQIDGRATVDFTGRCRMEIAYIRHPSLRRYVVLLVRTPMAVLRRTGVA
jgi:lipopolysaccharide/colanic/teichoic acid biosynthesis glycosyltransferase